MPTFIQVTSTLPSRQQALQLAQQIVDARLAACAQVSGPITSVYHWQGAVETSEEWVVVAKTCQEQWKNLERTIRECHPYDVPEIIAVPILVGSRGYLDWMAAELAPTPEP